MSFSKVKFFTGSFFCLFLMTDAMASQNLPRLSVLSDYATGAMAVMGPSAPVNDTIVAQAGTVGDTKDPSGQLLFFDTGGNYLSETSSFPDGADFVTPTILKSGMVAAMLSGSAKADFLLYDPKTTTSTFLQVHRGLFESTPVELPNGLILERSWGVGNSFGICTVHQTYISPDGKIFADFKKTGNCWLMTDPFVQHDGSSVIPMASEDRNTLFEFLDPQGNLIAETSVPHGQCNSVAETKDFNIMVLCHDGELEIVKPDGTVKTSTSLGVSGNPVVRRQKNGNLVVGIQNSVFFMDEDGVVTQTLTLSVPPSDDIDFDFWSDGTICWYAVYVTESSGTNILYKIDLSGTVLNQVVVESSSTRKWAKTRGHALGGDIHSSNMVDGLFYVLLTSGNGFAVYGSDGNLTYTNPGQNQSVNGPQLIKPYSSGELIFAMSNIQDPTGPGSEIRFFSAK